MSKCVILLKIMNCSQNCRSVDPETIFTRQFSLQFSKTSKRKKVFMSFQLINSRILLGIFRKKKKKIQTVLCLDSKNLNISLQKSTNICVLSRSKKILSVFCKDCSYIIYKKPYSLLLLVIKDKCKNAIEMIKYLILHGYARTWIYLNNIM